MPFAPPPSWDAAEIGTDRWAVINPFVGMWVMAVRQGGRWYYRVYRGGTLLRRGFESVGDACEYAEF